MADGPLREPDLRRSVPIDVYLNVAVAGILTGLVYGLMALGLSVIFGVVRVVNFAHGEMMSIAMYLTVLLFSGLHLDPLVMLVPIAAVLFVFGYALQAGLINPFISRPEHSQFLLLVALALIIVNSLLILFGPHSPDVLRVRQLPMGRANCRCHQALCRRGGNPGCRAAICVFPLRGGRQGHTCLRR